MCEFYNDSQIIVQKLRLKKGFCCGVRGRRPLTGMSMFKTFMSGEVLYLVQKTLKDDINVFYFNMDKK